uniref:EF-hand domain-containing protein n=1 Tax=Parastrongyloides trichosuri TaxID=131310 RepID=A0A0N5A4Y6_PARTI
MSSLVGKSNSIKEKISSHPQYGNFSSMQTSSFLKPPVNLSENLSSNIPMSSPIKRNYISNNNGSKDTSPTMESGNLLFSSAAKRLSQAFTFWKMNNLTNFKISSHEFTTLEKELEKQNITGTKCKEALNWLISNNGNYDKQFKQFGICLYILSRHIFVSKQMAIDALFESARQGVLTFSELRNSYYIKCIEKMEPDVSLSLEQLALIIKKIIKKRYT